MSTPNGIIVKYENTTEQRRQRTRKEKILKRGVNRATYSSNRSGLEKRVNHNYRDCAQLKCSPYLLNKPRVGRGGVTTPFPEKLHKMLEDAEASISYKSIICWAPHGRAFVIRDSKQFVNDVMPKYFRQTKLTSFQRQLNLYGFKRITRGKDRGGYYHEFFLRERKELSILMTRTKVKGTGCKVPNNPETEPDFYSMPVPKAVGSEDRSQLLEPILFEYSPLESSISSISLSSNYLNMSTIESIKDEVNFLATKDDGDEKCWSYTKWLLGEDFDSLSLEPEVVSNFYTDFTTDESASSDRQLGQLFAA